MSFVIRRWCVKIRQMSKRKLPNPVDMIQTLVQTPSVSCVNAQFDMSNRPVCNVLANWFDGIGCDVDLMEIPGTRDNVNFVARFGNGPAGLAFCGHTDTVPFDEKLWSTDPLGAEIRENKLYGVGSTDMKGFLALCAHVLEHTESRKLQRSIIVIGSADEESSMDGARALCDIDFEMPPFCIVGEPTGLQPIRRHKGTLMERVTLTGKSGHSSDPALGVNAIEAMHQLITVLLQYREDLQQRYRDDSFAVPYPTLNFGHIRGGDNPNRICGSCSIDFDLRLMPGMTVDETRTELHRRVREAMSNWPVTINFTALFQGANPLSTSVTSPLLAACERHSCQSHGSVNFCTEAPFYATLGAQSVVMGPGDIALAHQPDEYLALEAVDPMVNIMHKLIEQFCRPDTR